MTSTYLYNPRYVARTVQVFSSAINQYPRLSTFRFDLRFPANDICRNDEYVISRFFDSLKYNMEALFQAKRQAGIACDHPTSLRYIWCREYGKENGNRHYHVMLLVNKDTFHSPGSYILPANREFLSLTNLVQKSWCSALATSLQQYSYLAWLPENACIWIERKNPECNTQYNEAFRRAKYLCKETTKYYRNGRSFGCSQAEPSVIGSRRKRN